MLDSLIQRKKTQAQNKKISSILIKKEKIVNEQGEEEVRDICEFGINLDERIADGFYFAKSVRLFAHILNNPKLLEGKASEKIEIE